jgi:hypothetical protein
MSASQEQQQSIQGHVWDSVLRDGTIVMRNMQSHDRLA